MNSKNWGRPMSITFTNSTSRLTFMNWTSRVAVSGRVAEERRPDNWNELSTPGDYHLPFGKAEAKAEAAKWLCQV
jgi:hypothetical protein